MRTDFFNLALLAVLLTGAHAANSEKFYVTEPACQNEGCTVTVQAGSSLHINWLNPVKGKINIRLVPEESNKNAKTVKIATKIGAHSNSKSCDKYDAKSCGAFDWAVPKTVKAGQYSIDIHSLADKSVHGYSDIITIAAAASSSSANNDNVAPSTNQTNQAAENESDPTTSNSPSKAYTAMGRPDSRRVLVKRSADHKNKTESKKEHVDDKHHRKHHHHKNATLAAEHEHHKNKTVHDEKHHHRHNGTHHHHHNGTRKDGGDKKKKHHGKGKKDHKKSKKHHNSTEDAQKTDSSMSERDVILTKLF